MKILFWNVRGVGKPHRRKLVANHVLQDDLDVVAIQETIKQDCNDKVLKDMAGNKNLLWLWTPARGHFGGMALGINSDLLEIEQSRSLHYSVWALVRNRLSNFRFWVVCVYGPAQHELSADFILELSDMCSTVELPVVMGVTSILLETIEIEIGVRGTNL